MAVRPWRSAPGAAVLKKWRHQTWTELGATAAWIHNSDGQETVNTCHMLNIHLHICIQYIHVCFSNLLTYVIICFTYILYYICVYIYDPFVFYLRRINTSYAGLIMVDNAQWYDQVWFAMVKRHWSLIKLTRMLVSHHMISSVILQISKHLRELQKSTQSVIEGGKWF